MLSGLELVRMLNLAAPPPPSSSALRMGTSIYDVITEGEGGLVEKYHSNPYVKIRVLEGR